VLIVTNTRDENQSINSSYYVQ